MGRGGSRQGSASQSSLLFTMEPICLVCRSAVILGRSPGPTWRLATRGFGSSATCVWTLELPLAPFYLHFICISQAPAVVRVWLGDPSDPAPVSPRLGGLSILCLLQPTACLSPHGGGCRCGREKGVEVEDHQPVPYARYPPVTDQSGDEPFWEGKGGQGQVKERPGTSEPGAAGSRRRKQAPSQGGTVHPPDSSNQERPISNRSAHLQVSAFSS